MSFITGMTQWAVASGLLILMVLGVRWLLKDRLSARQRYALWAVVLVRLLCPFQLQGLPAQLYAALPVTASGLSQALSQRLFSGERYSGVAYAAQVPAGALDWEEEVPEGEVVYLLPSYHAPLLDDLPVEEGEILYRTVALGDRAVADLLRRPWLAGMGVVGGAMLLSNLRFARRLRRRRVPVELEDVPLPVFAAEGLPSPCLFGLLRPGVYLSRPLPQDRAVLRHILAHELTHFAHRDHLWSLLRCAALVLHWYNPLVWLAAAVSRTDGELACDEGAVARLGEGERIPYGRTLVDMVARRGARPADLLSLSTAMTGGRAVRQRVERLVRRQETGKAALFAAAAAVSLAAVFVFVGQGTGSALRAYLELVEQSETLAYAPPPSSSQYYPAISDRDLVERARAALADVEPIPAGAQHALELPEALAMCPRLSLAGDSTQYALVTQDSWTYLCLLRGGYWSEQPDPLPLARGSGALPSVLEALARQQYSRDMDRAAPNPSDRAQYEACLSAAQGIWMNMPMLHDGRVLTDPELLEQVRQLLALDPVPQGEPAAWDGRLDDIISFADTPPDPDWTGGPEWYNLTGGDGGLYYVYSTADRDSGTCLGTLSGERWAQARAILWQAPSVDDRRHEALSAAPAEDGGR